MQLQYGPDLAANSQGLGANRAGTQGEAGPEPAVGLLACPAISPLPAPPAPGPERPTDASAGGTRGIHPDSRTSLPFRAVNRPGRAGHDAGLQRHHLLPRQLVSVSSLARLFDRLGREAIGLEDFRRNGLLLPSSEQAARILGLPLHRGPHRDYNRMVIDRVGLIEGSWSRERLRRGDAALGSVLFRLRLLQQALRRRLLQPGNRRLVLNGRDPALANDAFAELDAMADLLWSEAEVAEQALW